MARMDRSCSSGRNLLDELAEEAGRDPSTIDILAFGHAGHFKHREEVLALQEAGADRVTIWLEETEGEGALAEMEEIAQLVLSRRRAPSRSMAPTCNSHRVSEDLWA